MKSIHVKQILFLLVILILIIGMLLKRIPVKQTEVISIPVPVEKTKEISVFLSPQSAQIPKGSRQTYQIVLKNNSTTDKNINVAGSDISYPAGIVTISEVGCGSDIPSSARTTADNGKIYISCFTAPGGKPYILASGGSVVLGSFTATVVSEPTAGEGIFAFTRVLLPEAVIGGDVSDTGTGATFTVIQ
jgi:hypothetical protein